MSETIGKSKATQKIQNTEYINVIDVAWMFYFKYIKEINCIVTSDPTSNADACTRTTLMCWEEK